MVVWSRGANLTAGPGARFGMRRVPRHLVWLVGFALAAHAGCGGPRDEPEIVWGKRGVANGDFVRPRAAAIDDKDHLYVVDYTARIQVFDRDGKFLGPCWTTPDYRNGRPSGLC